MKDRKRFVLIFALFWVIGLTGGYFLGVGSSFLPKENVEYNYYFSEKAEDSDVEPISKCKKADAENTPEESKIHALLRKTGLLNLPQRVVDGLIQ